MTEKSHNPFIRVGALAIAIGFSAVLLLPVSALALSEKDAATVVRLIEALQPELGNFAYDEDVAEDLFEHDLANLSEAEILETLADARRNVEEAQQLTSDQKQELLQMVDEQKKEV